jgi:hypothetical protein
LFQARQVRRDRNLGSFVQRRRKRIALRKEFILGLPRSGLEAGRILAGRLQNLGDTREIRARIPGKIMIARILAAKSLIWRDPSGGTLPSSGLTNLPRSTSLWIGKS